MEQKQLRPLSTIGSGQTVKLAKIDAGQALNSRLASMGLVANVEITIVNSGHPGPFVISVKGSKMLIGKGIAHKIMVL